MLKLDLWLRDIAPSAELLTLKAGTLALVYLRRGRHHPQQRHRLA
jgi:uncharacterized protein YeaO (DUF488 family)